MFGHFGQGGFPRHSFETAILVELSILHAHQRASEAVLAIKDFGVEVALDTVEAPVDRRIGITLGSNNTTISDAYLQAAAGAAKAADALVPSNVIVKFGRFCSCS